VGRDARRGRGDDPGPRRQPVALDRLAAGDDDRRGPVRERRGAAGGDDPVLLEGGLELGQRLGARVGARDLVGLEVAVARLDGHEVERQALARLGRELLGAQAPRVGLLARDPVQHRDLLGRLAEADGRLAAVDLLHLRVDEPPAERGVGDVGGRRPRARALGQDHRRAGHRLHAAGDDDVGLAGADLLGRRGDRLQAARAQAVDGVAGDLLREPGEQRGHARDVAVVLAGLVGGAEDHLVDGVVGDARAVERGAEHERGEVVGAGVGQRAAIAPEGRADAADEEGIGHGERSIRSVSSLRTAAASSSLTPWSSSS
jgi:hypothetical protein